MTLPPILDFARFHNSDVARVVGTESNLASLSISQLTRSRLPIYQIRHRGLSGIKIVFVLGVHTLEGLLSLVLEDNRPEATVGKRSDGRRYCRVKGAVVVQSAAACCAQTHTISTHNAGELGSGRGD